MPTIVEMIFVVVVMIIAFFLVFFAMFLLALLLDPIERSLSKMIWDMKKLKNPEPEQQPKIGSFKDFSKKH